MTPDDLRGRISGVEIAVYAGAACVAAAAVFAVRVKSFARYVAADTEPAPSTERAE